MVLKKEGDTPANKYDKVEFFDHMSCEALEKLSLAGNTLEPRKSFQVIFTFNSLFKIIINININMNINVGTKEIGYGNIWTTCT